MPHSTAPFFLHSWTGPEDIQTVPYGTGIVMQLVFGHMVKQCQTTGRYLVYQIEYEKGIKYMRYGVKYNKSIIQIFSPLIIWRKYQQKKSHKSQFIYFFSSSSLAIT